MRTTLLLAGTGSGSGSGSVLPPPPPPPPPRGYVISPSGSDSTGTGSVNNPWATISKFWSLPPAPGDHLLCRGGTFNGSGNRNQTVSVQGTLADPIVIEAYPGETPVFDGEANGSSDTDRFFVLGYPEFTHVVFDGLTLVNYCKDQNGVMTFAGLSGQESGDITISNCNITKVGPQTASPNSSQIIYFGAYVTTATVEDNTITGPYPTVGTDGAGVGTDHGPPSTKGLVVNGNTFVNCHKGTQIYGEDGSPNGVTVTITDNVYTNCGRNIELVHYMTCTATGNSGTIASESSSYNLYDSGSGTLIASGNTWT